MLTLRAALAISIVSIAGRVAATDYPTKPDDMDKLCEVIGEAPNLSVPPKDRLWFKENCSCSTGTGCGHPGSKRYGVRLAAMKKELQAKAAAAEAKEAEAQRRAAAEAAARKDFNEKVAPAALRLVEERAATDPDSRMFAWSTALNYCKEQPRPPALAERAFAQACEEIADTAKRGAREQQLKAWYTLSPQRDAHFACMDAVGPATPRPPGDERYCEATFVMFQRACAAAGIAWPSCVKRSPSD